MSKFILNRRRVAESEYGPVLRMDFVSEDGKEQKFFSYQLGVYPRSAASVADSLIEAGKSLGRAQKGWSDE